MELGDILIIGVILATGLLIAIIGLLAKIYTSLDETLDVVYSIEDRLEKRDKIDTKPEESTPIVSVILREVLERANLKDACDNAAKELEKNIPGYVSECIKSDFAKKPCGISNHQYARMIEEFFKTK